MNKAIQMNRYFPNKILAVLFIFASCLIQANAESYDDMMQAVKNDFAGDAQTLLDRGFDVNTIDEKGNSLIMLAAFNNSPRVFDVLMGYKPNLELKNLYGESVLMLASYRHSAKMVNSLLSNGAKVNTSGWTALHYAASSGDLEVVNALIKAGADINAVAPDGSSPMIMAAREGHIEIIKLLLSLHANTDIQNENGMTALKWSLKRDDTDIMELLVEANAGR